MAEAHLGTSTVDGTSNDAPMNTTIDITGWNSHEGEDGDMSIESNESLPPKDSSSDEGECHECMISYPRSGPE